MIRDRLLALLLGLTLSAGVAAAQTPYDAPSVSAVDRFYTTPSGLKVGTGLFRITLAITAGQSGAPAGFTIQWMKKSDYDALGGWADEGNPALKYCQCYGPYTLNQWAGNPAMGSGETSYLQLGDLNDESGLYGNDYDQLLPGTEYVVRGYAEGDGNGDPSTFSNTVTTSTLTSECTQGFWKTHGPGLCHSGSNSNVWPAGCFPMKVGDKGTGYAYTDLEICSILLRSVGGNGLISLAHQVITTKLNGCSTSDLTPVATALADAQALIGNLVVPPVGTDPPNHLDPSVTSDLTETLDDYNNGLLGGVANCPTNARTTSTWGRIKVLYR